MPNSAATLAALRPLERHSSSASCLVFFGVARPARELAS